MLREDALKDKVILITGGGSGLGKSMGTYFLELGAKLIITSRKMEKLEKAAEEMKEKTGGEVLCVAGDVRNYEDAEKVIEESYNKFGRVDILVNNAAGNFISPTERLSPGAFDAIIGIVLKGTVNFTLALGKKWIADKQPGSILNVVTTYAFTGSGYVVPSACAKAGVLAMTKSLGSEWGKYNIRVNAVAPGPFPTEGAWARLMPGDLQEKFDPKNKIPAGRFGEHQELANLAAYLVSDFSAYMTGECVVIDGGEWLRGAGQFNLLEMVSPDMWDMFEQMTRGAK